ncbi:hypothetical protein NDU88_001647 [Pleurodeles waltl]|uniref:Uncharacterized protein n=1 Tax=Pleurodeles waltl TaxID=8319 RepID=A0AAV7P7U1_PLEWA|nr:hypothetical protein NDU88_001647 [Pleurodeles waltl]
MERVMSTPSSDGGSRMNEGTLRWRRLTHGDGGLKAPNNDDTEFFEVVERELAPYVGVPLIWGRDFNYLLDGAVDSHLLAGHQAMHGVQTEGDHG